jgi:hypothetical protein
LCENLSNKFNFEQAKPQVRTHIGYETFMFHNLILRGNYVQGIKILFALAKKRRPQGVFVIMRYGVAQENSSFV